MKKDDIITIEPPTPITVCDRLGWALHALEQAISKTDGGRACSLPIWSSLHECRGHILAARRKLLTESK